MKFIVAAALLAVTVYADNAPDVAQAAGAAPSVAGAAQGAAEAGGEPLKKIKEFIPPILASAFEKFSPAGKEAMKTIMEAAKSAKQAGQPLGEDKVMEMLKEKSPADAELLAKAQKELDDAVAKLSKPVQDVYALAKKLFESRGFKNIADLQPFAKAIQDLTDADRKEFFKLFPSTEKFYNSDAFKKAAAGTA